MRFLGIRRLRELKMLQRSKGVVVLMGRRSLGSFRYEQGQYNASDPGIREYFYCVDHNGMLFLDDARMKNFTSCFKDQKFLRFFFGRIRRTVSSDDNPQLQVAFPFTSHCGRERNYIRVDATPFVFTKVVDGDALELNGTGLTRQFVPASLYEGTDGRLYHEFAHRDVGFALVKSSVADGIFPGLVYDEEGGNRAVGFRVGGGIVPLDYRVKDEVEAVIQYL